jgi:integrase
MACLSFQRGYVSDPIKTRTGTVFVIRYRLRSADGKWIHKSENLHGLESKKAARAVLQQRLQKCMTQPVNTAELSVSDFVEHYWKPYLDRKGVKPSTRKSYESGIKRHILPRIGEMPLPSVTPLQVEEFLRGRLENGASPKTVRNDLALLQSVFSLAEDNDLIPKSPIRRKHKPCIQKTEKPVWTADEVRKIIQAAPSGFRPLLTCAALTGVRLGELLAIQWKHIDFVQGVLHIRQSLWNGQTLPPKTAGSVRTVAFGPVLKQALLEQRANSQFTASENFVFCKGNGEPLNADVLRRDVLYPTLDRLQISRSKRNAGFHTFRHSVATFVNEQTGNIKLAQKLLGHSNLSTTADVYTHTSAQAERGAALAVERAIYGDLFVNVRENANTNTTAALN